MPKTNLALLHRMKNLKDDASWNQFIQTYAPVIAGIARRYRVDEDQVADIQQEVFLQMAKVIRSFKKDPKLGRFRSYLARMTVNKVNDMWRKKRERSGGLENPHLIEDSFVRESHSEIEVQRHVMNRAVTQVRERSRSVTWTCFQEHVLGKRPAIEVANELGVSVNAVFVNCARTTERIRKTALQLRRLNEPSDVRLL